MGAGKVLHMAVMASVVAVGIQAEAQKVIAKSKDWILTDYSTAQNPNGNCVASTGESLKKNKAYLEVYGKKGSRQVLEVMIRQVGADLGHTGIYLSTKDNSTRLAAAPLQRDATNQFFWIVPQNTQHLIAVLDAVKEMKVLSVGGTRALDFEFSTKGFGKIIQEMQRLCINGPQVNQAFEAMFLSGSQQTVDPVRLDVGTTQTLRNLYHQAHKLFLGKLDNKEQLDKLSAQYANELTELAGLNATIQRLEGQEIPKLISQINQTESTRIESEKRLVQVRASIPGLAAAEQKAEAHLNAMEAIVAPLRPEYNQRSGALYDARQDLEQAEDRLDQVRRELVRIEREIISLRAEAQSLDQRMDRTRNDLIYARDQHTRAERELRRFDREREIRERLARETSYDRDVREARDKRTNVLALERELSTANSQLAAKEQALRTCQATAGADCSQQQADVTSARSARDIIKGQLSTEKSALEAIERRIRNIEERVRRDVDREYDILADRERETRRRVNELESSLESDDRRYNLIVNTEIPSLISQSHQLNNEENSLERNIPYIQAEITRLAQELAAFKKRTGWDVKKANLDAAQADFNKKAAAHEAALDEEANLVRTIEHCKTEKPRLENLLATAQSQLANAKARKAVVAKALEPFFAQKAILDQKDQGFVAQIGQLARDFEAKIPR